MSETTPPFYMAVAEIETQKDGKRHYIKPGMPVYDLDEKDIKSLKECAALREPTDAEVELENLRANQTDAADKPKRNRAKGNATEESGI